ncbi:MAG: DUF4255 domain-containing protein [Bacteroidota bacterium]
MIYQALKLIATELNSHLNAIGQLDSGVNDDEVQIANIATLDSGLTADPPIANKVVLTMVRMEEESSLKNISTRRKNLSTDQTEYRNPPVHVHLYLLFSINSNDYENALTYLSRVVRFFQSKNVFTSKNTPPISSTNAHDQLNHFKLILDMYSPSFEEANNIWGMLGGRQLPHVMYKMRMLELELDQVKDRRPDIRNIKINDPTTV